MINHYLTRLYTALIGLFVGARHRATAPARGANFIEYAMLGVIAIFIGFIFRTQLTSAFNSILGQITAGLGSGGSSTGGA